MLRDRRLEELLERAAGSADNPSPRRKKRRRAKAKPIKIHETERYIRKRMRDPAEFDPRSFRIKDPGRRGHTKLVIACPKGFYHRGRCTVGTHVQAILREK